jgi:hypothetical protein
MANLNGQNIGTNYKGILNLSTTINTGLSGTLQPITDGDGNESVVQISNESLRVVNVAEPIKYTLFRVQPVGGQVTLTFGNGNGETNTIVYGAARTFVFNSKVQATTLNLSAIPTSAAGLSAGDVWSDGGTLKIV